MRFVGSGIYRALEFRLYPQKRQRLKAALQQTVLLPFRAIVHRQSFTVRGTSIRSPARHLILFHECILTESQDTCRTGLSVVIETKVEQVAISGHLVNRRFKSLQLVGQLDVAGRCGAAGGV